MLEFIAGLCDKEFIFSLGKKLATTFNEVLHRAQRYILGGCCSSLIIISLLNLRRKNKEQNPKEKAIIPRQGASMRTDMGDRVMIVAKISEQVEEGASANIRPPLFQ